MPSVIVEPESTTPTPEPPGLILLATTLLATAALLRRSPASKITV